MILFSQSDHVNRIARLDDERLGRLRCISSLPALLHLPPVFY